VYANFFGSGQSPVSEARVIRATKVVTIGKSREERLEHARRRWQSMQQQKRRRRPLAPPLCKKDRHAVYLYRAISRWRLRGRKLYLLVSGHGETSKVDFQPTARETETRDTVHTATGFFFCRRRACSSSRCGIRDFRCSRMSPSVATDTTSLTTRVICRGPELLLRHGHKTLSAASVLRRVPSLHQFQRRRAP